MLKAFFDKTKLEAGCDEAGRGCLAGPVFAAAVIWPHNLTHPLLKDSKLLSEKQRLETRAFIEENAIAWAVASLSPSEIDQYNILNASFMAMHKAIEELKQKPELLLIDGNRFQAFKDIPHECIVKGDNKYLCIAAASILAKTCRDEYMMQIAKDYPYYDWQSNKGYPTKSHRLAIAQHGSSVHHRKSFKLTTPTDA